MVAFVGTTGKTSDSRAPDMDPDRKTRKRERIMEEFFCISFGFLGK
jgi:hypothetical protein